MSKININGNINGNVNLGDTSEVSAVRSLTHYEVMNLLNGLSKTDFDNIEDGKFGYAIQRNIDKLKSCQKAIVEAEKKNKGKELLTLEEKYANELQEVKTELLKQKGGTVLVSELNDAIEDFYAAQEEGERIKELQEKFVKKHELFMEETSDFKPYYLDANHAMSLPLKNSQMSVIMPILKEPEEEKKK